MKKYNYRILYSFLLMILSVVTFCIIAVNIKTIFYGSENISTLLTIIGFSLLVATGWVIKYKVGKKKIEIATAIVWFFTFVVYTIQLIIVSIPK